MNNALLDHLATCRPAMLEALEALVVRESPSRDRAAIGALATDLGARFEGLGLAVERIGEDGENLRVVFGAPVDGREPGLVLCHFDTVWPLGTLARMPFRIENGRAHGPGAYDMKASLVLCEFAVRAVRALSLQPARPVVFLFTCDEEIGSPSSRTLIEDEARRSAYVLVMEPPLSDNRLKTARKGVGRFTLEITGRASHAGVEPDKGVSAVTELAHQILAINAMADPPRGTTLNVGVVQGGTTPNVVPAEASAQIDVRATSLDEAARVTAAMSALRPVLPGAALRVGGGFNRPPMERTPQVAALFERVRAIGKSVGLDLGEGSTGGGSDGNFTAALGRPTIDGLGTPGAGAHAEHEHVLIEALPVRAALLAALLLEL